MAYEHVNREGLKPSVGPNDLRPLREKLITWDDPTAITASASGLTGRQFLEHIAEGKIPYPPILRLIGLRLAAITDGEVSFVGVPDESVYNPLGIVHGGYMCTMLDTALGCAAHSLLPAGTVHTSVEIKVNYLRPVRADAGVLTVTGRVTKPGRRISFTEGEITDPAGVPVATAQSSILIIGPTEQPNT